MLRLIALVLLTLNTNNAVHSHTINRAPAVVESIERAPAFDCNTDSECEAMHGVDLFGNQLN